MVVGGAIVGDKVGVGDTRLGVAVAVAVGMRVLVDWIVGVGAGVGAPQAVMIKIHRETRQTRNLPRLLFLPIPCLRFTNFRI